jgi:hypothetical protein
VGRILGKTGLLLLALAACSGGSSATSAGDASGLEAASQTDAGADVAVDATAEATAEAGDDSGRDSTVGPGDDSGPEAGDDTGIPLLMCGSDAPEDNSTEVTALPLPGIDSCDSSGTSLSAISSGTGDTDWYHYFGTSSATSLCIADPTAQVDASGLRVCIFIICPTGTTTIQSCTNGSPDMSPAGTPGCCTTSTAAMTVDISCGGVATTNSADVYMRVDQPTSNSCIPYDLAYHF